MSFLEEAARDASARAAALPPRPPRGLARPPRRSLAAALVARAPCALIAEVKRRSPSAGPLWEGLDPARLAREYAAAGAAAISVLTEPARFGGSLADLEQVAAAVEVPVLRKDFLVDPRQLAESRSAGADAVLLIARMLEGSRLAELVQAAAEEGLEPFGEAHAPQEVGRALAAGARVVGVNNRDLATLRTDAAHSLRVAAEARDLGLPWPEVAVSESGIATRGQVEELARAGYRAILVGEALLAAREPGRAILELLDAGLPGPDDASPPPGDAPTDPPRARDGIG